MRLEPRRVLFGLGLFCALWGVGTVLYSVFILRPRLTVLSDEAITTLDQVRTAPEFTRLMQGTAALTTALPETFKQLRGTLVQGSKASASAGQTAEEAQKGPTGLVLPKDEVKQSAHALKKTSDKFEKLSVAISQLEDASGQLAQAATPLTGERSPGLQQMLSRLNSARDSIAYAALPRQAVLLGLTLGVIALVLGGALICASQLVTSRRNG